MKRKIIAPLLIFMGFSIPTTTLAVSCGTKPTTKQFTITTSGVDGIILSKTTIEENQKLQTNISTQNGNYDILKIVSIKIGNNVLLENQYTFELTKNALHYVLTIDAAYIKDNINIQFTSTPGVIFGIKNPDFETSIIAAQPSIRVEKNTNATYSCKLTQKSIIENRKIRPFKVFYYGDTGLEVILDIATDYTYEWNETNHECTVTIAKKEIVNHNLFFAFTTSPDEQKINLSHFIGDSETLGKVGISCSSSPLSLNEQEQYHFIIDPSKWPEERRPDAENFAWEFRVIYANTTPKGHASFDPHNVEVKVGGKKLVYLKDYKVVDSLIITGIGDYEHITWGKTVDISLFLDSGGKPQQGLQLYPALFADIPTTPTRVDMPKFDAEKEMITTSTDTVELLADKYYMFAVDVSDWPEQKRTSPDGLVWNFSLLDPEKKTPLKVIWAVPGEDVRIFWGIDDLGPTEFGVRANSVLYGIDADPDFHKTVPYTIKLGFVVKVKKSVIKADKLVCKPAFYEQKSKN